MKSIRRPRSSSFADILINAWEGTTIRMQIDRDIAPLDEFLNITLDRALATR